MDGKARYFPSFNNCILHPCSLDSGNPCRNDGDFYLYRYLWLAGKIYLSILGLLVFFAGAALAAETQGRILILKNTDSSLSAAPYLDVLEDPSQQLTLTDVMSPAYADKFIANSQEHPYFGRSRSAFWLRFELSNQSGLNWYLLMDDLLGDQLDLFVIQDHNTVTQPQRQSHYGRPLWSLQLPQGASWHFYIRATNGDALVKLPVELLTADTLIQRGNHYYRFHAALYAALLILAAYNFVLFFTLREASYLTLVVHIVSVFISIHLYNPVFESLWFFSRTNNYFFTAPPFIAIGSLSLFVSQILQTRLYLPKLDTTLKALFWLSLAFTAITGLIPGGPAIPPILILAIFVTVLLSSWLAYRTGETIAKYFFFIFIIVFMMDIPIFILMVFKTSHWTAQKDDIVGVSIVILALLLSLVQAERVRLMRENMQRIKLAGEAKDSFLASMSHELRTPLNSIFGLSTLLQLGKLDDNQSNYVKKLSASARYMLQLIGNILDIKKIENKNFHLESKPFSLKAVLASVYDLLYEQAQAKGLGLVFEGDDEITETICGDRLRLSQVLINLVGNGIKYTQRGEVRLIVHKLASSTPAVLAVQLDVTDTGIGIPAHKMASLFKPFVQLEEGYCKDGAGLGLFISKNLVEMMGGALEVNSVPDKGTKFFFSLLLPVHETTAYPVQHISDPNVHFSLPGTRILLVDDYELNVFIWRKLITHIGGDVTIALDGKSTILQLQQSGFDIVLIDISLPDMDGFEVTRWIRVHSQNPKIPILALTAYATAEVEQQCKHAGMDGFLSKPFELYELYSAIKQILYK